MQNVSAGVSPLATNYDSSAPPRVRWWVLLAFLALIALVIAIVQLSDRVEGNFKMPLSAAAILLIILFVPVWVLLFSGLPRGTRRKWLLAELALVALPLLFVKFTMRVEGSVTGAGVPRLVWLWAAKPDAALGHRELATAAAPVDLKTTTPDDFAEFLGAGRHNQVASTALSPDWSAHPPRQLWRQPIGLGWGSFAIVNGFAVTQEQRGTEEFVTCLDVKTGQARWQHANTVRFSERLGGDGPRATPTILDGRVYAMGATGILDCLDGATGKVIWSRQILKDISAPNVTWGKSCSPLIYDRFVVVTGGAAKGPSLLAYDRDTGSPLWTGGTDEASYCSPTVATVAGIQQVFIVNAHSVTGHDALTGKVLWDFPWPGNWPKASQVIPLEGDRVLASSGYGIGSVVLQIAATGSGVSATPVWKNLRLKTEFTNICQLDGFLYGLDDGVLTCIEATTGKRRWRDGRYGHGQILLAGKLLIVQTEPGDVVLVDASPDTFQEHGTIAALTSKTWNNPALYGHLLLVRNDREAACYELP